MRSVRISRRNVVYGRGQRFGVLAAADPQPFPGLRAAVHGTRAPRTQRDRCQSLSEILARRQLHGRRNTRRANARRIANNAGYVLNIFFPKKFPEVSDIFHNANNGFSIGKAGAWIQYLGCGFCQNRLIPCRLQYSPPYSKSDQHVLGFVTIREVYLKTTFPLVRNPTLTPF